MDLLAAFTTSACPRVCKVIPPLDRIPLVECPLAEAPGLKSPGCCRNCLLDGNRWVRHSYAKTTAHVFELTTNSTIANKKKLRRISERFPFVRTSMSDHLVCYKNRHFKGLVLQFLQGKNGLLHFDGKSEESFKLLHSVDELTDLDRQF